MATAVDAGPCTWLNFRSVSNCRYMMTNQVADLGGMIMSGIRSAAFFEKTGMAEDLDVSIRAVA